MPSPVRTLAVVLLAVASAALLVLGHQLFWFLCDDAYIAFRYVSNSQLGHGYTWNAPPFRPVEGYTSFLWVVILDLVWSLTGLDPTQSSNPLSLLCALASTALVGVWAWRLPLTGALRKARVGVLAAVLLGTVLNRTWLTWSTSGLETALFNLLLLGWIAAVALVPSRDHGRLSGARFAGLFTLAALLTLTRPDGLLFLAATGTTWLVWLVGRVRERQFSVLDALAVLPVAAPIAHLLWRRSTYGLWLPNTYYAKHVGLWPEAGLAYAFSYLLEYAAWLPLVLLLVALGRMLWRGALWPRSLGDLAWTGLVAAPVAHFAYYTLSVGGDHFEYRVYVHLVPLAFLGAAWALDRLGASRTTGVATLALAVLVSLPVPWGHWWLSSQLESRQETRMMTVDLSAHTPLPLRGYTQAFDLVQLYLQTHHVGTRHQEHKVFARVQAEKYPTREEGLQISGEGIPVHEVYSVGVPAWTLPHVAIIDMLGLNDAIVARNPVSGKRTRMMGHDRRPPKGYVECFQPNVNVRAGRAIERPRMLTPDEVVSCETRFYEQVMEAAH